MPAELKAADTLRDVPPNFIPKEPYLSSEFARLERERLWPRSWLIAAREEEVAKPGDFVMFEIGGESIIVVRDREARLHAFFNVCQHRGRQLIDKPGCGHTVKLFCKYHGWRWNLNGTSDVVVDREDWAGSLDANDIALKPLRLAIWGGFVFVNMDQDAEPLEQYLAPVIHAFRNYALEDMRYHWKRSTRVACNWKVAIDVFIEGYHAQTAHRQSNLDSGDNRFSCELFGPHSVFRYRQMPIMGEESPNAAYFGNFPEDIEAHKQANSRPKRLLNYFATLHRDLDALVTERFVRATQRLVDEMPADTPYFELMMALQRLHREEGARDGISWDALSMEEVAYLGMDWSIFPNVALLPTVDAVLMYRARPDGDDPDSCFLDVWSLQRYAPGTEPVVVEEKYERWEDCAWPRIYAQDFESVPFVQKGMKSRGFVGGRPNPIAEATVDNFQRHVREMVSGSGR